MTDPAPWLAAAGAEFVRQAPSHFERIGWDEQTLRLHQDEALRAVLRSAVTRSAFHRERLAGVSIDEFGIERIPELPVMTKELMMDHFDEVVTADRLRLDRIEAHLAAAGPEPRLVDGTYLVLATGGTSGVRGVHCYHRERVPEFLATVVRPSLAALASDFGWPLPIRPRVTMVAAPSSIHATRAMAGVLRGLADVTLAPVTTPFDELCREVEASEPMLLIGYTSIIARLADARRAGRLRVEPQAVVVTSEQLVEEDRARIVDGFGVPPVNSFGSSEGLVGTAPPGEDVFTFASDTVHVEFVDEHDRPVPPGTESDHILVTHLTNAAQPLIRLRMDDRMTEFPVSDGSAHKRAALVGRKEGGLCVGGTTVHPLVLRSELLHHPGVAAHQLIEHPEGIEVVLVPRAEVDVAAVSSGLTAALESAGAAGRVWCRVADQLERDPRTGKAPTILRRAGAAPVRA